MAEKTDKMPDIDLAKNELAIGTYLDDIPSINSEAAKSHRFTLLLNILFSVQPGFIEEYIQGIEKYLKVKEKDRIRRGQADQLSGNLIIEFEKNLKPIAKNKEAEDQLRKYTACVWSQEKSGKRTKFVCLATDGNRFKAYVPIATRDSKQLIEPEQIKLNLLEDIDAKKIGWNEFYFFLDRYLLRKEILHPTSEHIVKDFGPNSHAFKVAEVALLREWIGLKDHPDYGVLYEAWEKYLRIVYGSSLADEELFIRHTYLATLAKLMVWSRLSSRKDYPNDRDIISILEGTYFKEQMGIENFLEEDFFSWVARPEAEKTTMEIARPILRLLRNYNLQEISEDVLKSLYEGLVDPETRHDLGEYYTPDWLAHRIVRRLLEPKPKARVLDPACGSGTFIYMTIREKRRLLGDSAKTLKHICSSVIGLDIHPLACIVAKTNYVLALGDLLVKRKRKVAIPIYLANSIRPPEREVERQFWQKVECYKAEIDNHEVHIPELLINDPEKYDQAIEAAREFAVHAKGKNVHSRAFEKFLKTHYAGLVDSPEAARVLYSAAETLKDMIETGRDTIWAFVLKNIYKPLFLKNRFDLIIGNPPWLAYRYVERSDYQKFLKEQITKRYGLVVGRAELITHLELGTLFLARSVELYLKSKGQVAFVLPKSIFSADQHDALRRQQVEKVHLSPIELWDLEYVSPLFKTSAAVYFGENKKANTKVFIQGEVLGGKLPIRNANLEISEKELSIKKTNFNLSTMGKRSYWSSGQRVELAESPYRKLFNQGASIVPRCFWFVDIKTSELGFNETLPPLISSQRAQELAKKAYKDCIIEGTVENSFVYATLLPVDMVPFGHLRLRLVVLPIVIKHGFLKLQNANQAREVGFVHLADWLDKVEREWIKRAVSKTERMSSLEWLNYRKKLTQQNPYVPFKVIYATSGTHVCASVIKSRLLRHELSSSLNPKGFIGDTKTYYYDTDSYLESNYLASVLNTASVDSLIKPAQSKGLWGARDVHKKVLDLPIPRFNDKLKHHFRLADIGESCAKQVKKWIALGGPGNIRSIGVLRNKVREMLNKELDEIDSIVRPMLGL